MSRFEGRSNSVHRFVWRYFIGFLALLITLFLHTVWMSPISAQKNTPVEQFQTFKDWCLNRDSLSPNAKRTIDAILFPFKDSAFSSTTPDCDEAEKRLLDSSSLYLAGDSKLCPPENLEDRLYRFHIGQISDLRSLQSLPHLTKLILISEEPIDFSPLESLTQLTSLKLCSSQISNLNFLKSLTNLNTLSIYSSSQLVGLQSLESLPQLTNLKLSSIEGSQSVFDMRWLESLTQLTELELLGYEIENLDVIQKLKNLTRLEIVDGQLQNISSLRLLINLRELSLLSNQIADISPLQSLNHLTHLSLAFNQITDLQSLGALIKLKGLWIEGNPIRSKVCPVKPASICRF